MKRVWGVRHEEGKMVKNDQTRNAASATSARAMASRQCSSQQG